MKVNLLAVWKMYFCLCRSPFVHHLLTCPTFVFPDRVYLIVDDAAQIDRQLDADDARAGRQAWSSALRDSGHGQAHGPQHQAALQLRRPHHHGHQEGAREAADPLRDLPVHHGQLPVLPEEPEGLAELNQT